jgi:hypothetical protein
VEALLANTIRQLNVLSYLLRAVSSVRLPAQYTLYSINIALVLSLVYVLYKSYRSRVLRNNRVLNGIIVIVIFVGILNGVLLSVLVKSSFLDRLSEIPLTYYLEDSLLTFHTLYIYVNGIVSVLIILLVTFLIAFLKFHKLKSVKLYGFLVQLTGTYAIFRLPGLFLYTFAEPSVGILVQLLLESYHGVFDCIIICHIERF